jgi:hypothetical protein
MSNPTEHDELGRLADVLAAGAADFAKHALRDFKTASTAGFKVFDAAFCKSLITVRVECDLTPDGNASAVRLVAIAPDGRRTELG